MKARLVEDRKNILKEAHSALRSAVAQLDLRRTDHTVTQALCIIDASFESLVRGATLSAEDAFAKGEDWASGSGLLTSVIR